MGRRRTTVRPDHHSSCTALWCHNNGRNSKAKFFSFPVDDRYDAWLAYVHRRDLEHKSKEKIRTSHRICEEHFKDEDFADPGKTKLVWSAVPSAAVPPRLLRLLPCIKATGKTSCSCEPARKPSLNRKPKLAKSEASALEPVVGVRNPGRSSGITARSPEPDLNEDTEVSIPELEVGFDSRIPKPLEVLLDADQLCHLGEACMPEVDDEEGDEDDGCLYSDGAGSLAGSIGDDSDDDALTKTTGVQTDEGDAGVSTFSTFVCLVTKDGAATQVAHNPERPSPTQTPESSAKSSKKWTISYLVY